MSNLLSFAAFSVLAIFTPGPNNIMSLCIAGKYGFKRCLAFNFGVTVGFLLLMAASVAFSCVLFSAIPGLKPFLAAAGAVYMVYLAWKTLRSGKTGEGEKRSNAGFVTGVLLQFVNPKGVLFCIAVASSYLVPEYGATLPTMGFSLLLAVLVFASTCLWSACGAAFQRLIERHRLAFNIVMAVLLVYCAVSLFF